MATFSPSDGLAAGGTFWCESTVGEVGSVDEWSKLFAVVGVTGLVGWLVELLFGSPSLVRFFLRKPRLGMKTLRSGAQVVQTQEMGRKKGGGGTGARRHAAQSTAGAAGVVGRDEEGWVGRRKAESFSSVTAVNSLPCSSWFLAWGQGWAEQGQEGTESLGKLGLGLVESLTEPGWA